MADDLSKDPVGCVAEALIDASFEVVTPIFERADRPEADGQFHELVRLEVAGSMAISAVLRRYMRRAWRAAQSLNQDDLSQHLLQAAVSPVVGAIVAYTDDMPQIVRTTFLLAFVDTLNEAIKQRHKTETVRARKARNVRH
jgi:hypothetical protein